MPRNAFNSVSRRRAVGLSVNSLILLFLLAYFIMLTATIRLL